MTVFELSWIATEKHRREIHTWLSAPDSSKHDDAVKKRGPETGFWFVNGDVFNEWRTSPHSFLWIHGIRTCFREVDNSY